MKKVILIILIVLLCAVFCFSAYKVGSQLISERKDKNAFQELSELKNAAATGTLVISGSSQAGDGSAEQDADASGSSGGSDDQKIKVEMGSFNPQGQVLYKLNHDYFGWITIDDTTVDYPIVYTPEQPEYYLRRGFDGSYSYSGVPFIDASCARDGSFYLIYGHNMKNKTMFAPLMDYLDKSYCLEHSLIRFDTLTEERTYEVMSVFLTEIYPVDQTNVFRYYEYTDLSDQDVFEDYVKNVKALSAFDTGVNAVFGDELLALSTCSYHVANGRLVIVAKRIA